MNTKSVNSQLISVTKSDSEIKKTVLDTIMRMLVYRKWLSSDVWSDNKIKALAASIEGNLEDDVMLTKLKDMKLYVKSIPIKITGLNKVPSLGEFIDKYKNDYKIIIVKEITDKAKSTIVKLYPNVEIFKEKFLMFDIMSHHLCPEYVVLTPEQIIELLATYNCVITELPRLMHNDPAVDYLKLQKGQVVRLLRNSELSGQVAHYRVFL